MKVRRCEGLKVPRFVRLEEVESTNDVMLEMARRGEPEGTVVTALRQTMGRGRLGRSWWDKPGESAMLSVLLRPDKPVNELGQLAFVAGLAAAECLERELCPDVALKWPNDVLVRDKKIAGILVEIEKDIAVVGIGINVNQREFPQDIAETATSIALETRRERDIDGVVQQTAEAILSNYEAYLARGFEDILACWRKYMWGVGRQASVSAGDETIVGKIAGVDSRGALILIDGGNGEHIIHAADSFRLL